MAVNPLDFLKNMSSVKSNIDNIKKEMSKITVCGKAGSNIVGFRQWCFCANG